MTCTTDAGHFCRCVCRYSDAHAELRPVRGDGARAEGGQRSHGADVLLAEHAALQPGVGQGKNAGPEGGEEHRQSHGPSANADHADDAHVSQLVRGGPGQRVADRRALRHVPRRARLNGTRPPPPRAPVRRRRRRRVRTVRKCRR